MKKLLAKIFAKAVNSHENSTNGGTQKAKSPPRLRDLKNGLLLSRFKGMKDDLEYVISHQSNKEYKNLFLSELESCLNGINKLLEGENNTDKEELVRNFYYSLNDFFLFGYLLENDYLKPLIRKQSQLKFRDEYGDINSEQWDSELKRFALTHTWEINDYIEENTTHELRSRCLYYRDHMNFHFETDEFTMLDFYINQIIDFYIAQEPPDTFVDLSSITDPYEYERAIAEVISGLGVIARVTRGSGDQGADVIATHNGEDYIIQCKLYSKPVGNKAVQEVSAAQHFYSGNHALVVTNSSFTKSARQLADKLGVVLLHHSQIVEIFGEEDSDSATVPSGESCSYEAMIEALNSYDTERLKEHASEFLEIFEPAVSENMFVFDVGDCSAFVACFASEDEDVFRTYIDYLFKLTDGLSYDEKILFTFSDVEEDTLKFADDLDIRLFTDEKILDYLQGLIDIHIDEE